MNLKTPNDMTPEEAQAIIKANMKDMAKIVQDAIGVLHPELAESEDERMCTRCIDLLRKVSAYSGEEYLGVEIADCIIWLQALIKKLKESLHITEICKEGADSFTDEDERIRKGLIEVVSDIAGGWPFEEHRITKKEALAYLEKQKEQKPEERFKEAREKYQVEWSEDERITRAINNMLPFIPDEAYANNEVTKEDVVRWLEKQKEYTDTKQERIIKAARRVLNNWLYGDVSADVSGDLTELEYALKDYDGEEEQKEQKPAEWSEDDESMLEDIIDDYDNGEIVGDVMGKGMWLNNKFKSLRPSWKPSEEQMNILKAVKEYVGRGSGYWGEGLSSLIEDLEKLM